MYTVEWGMDGIVKKTNEKDDSTVFSPNYSYNGPTFLIQLKKEPWF